MLTHEQLRNRRRHEMQSYVGHFEKLPYSIISGVEINMHMAEHATDPQLRRLISQDWLMQNATVFAIGSDESSVKRLQAPRMFRGVILRLGTTPVTDEFGVQLGTVASKGTGITTHAATRILRSLSSTEPAGLFGWEHARQDMYVSDILASYGARTARGLGILTLNPEALLAWYHTRDVNQSSFYDLEQALGVIKKNGDVPVIYVRLMGAERMQEYNDARTLSEGVFTQEAMQKRAVRLLTSEIAKRGIGAFEKHYGLPRLNGLDNYMQGNSSVTDEQFLAFFRTYFHYLNIGIKDRVSHEYFDNRLTVSIDTRNIDLTGMWYDYETSVPGKGYDSRQTYGGIDLQKSISLLGSDAVDELARKALTRGKNASPLRV